MARSCAPGLTLALLLAAAPLWAQETSEQPSAEALFREGRTLIEAGNVAAACDKFEASQRLDPAAGTLTNLAACRERLGQLTRAREAWQAALAVMKTDDPRRTPTLRRAEQLDARIPKITISAGPDAPADMVVMRDGLELSRASFGVALPVDPGPHEFTVLAPGRQKRRYVVKAEESKSIVLVVEVGAADNAAPAPALEPKTTAPSSAGTRSRHNWRPAFRTTGVILGGVGTAGLVVGGLFGALAVREKDRMETACTEFEGTFYCDESGLDAADRGDRYASISTVTLIAGGAALALGTVVYVLAPRKPGVAPKRGRSASSGHASAKLEAAPLPGGATVSFTAQF
jgi:hypothetical protein